jgi:hypothetical protein
VALAKELIEVESIEAGELRRIIDSYSNGPQVVPGTTTGAKRIG